MSKEIDPFCFPLECLMGGKGKTSHIIETNLCFRILVFFFYSIEFISEIDVHISFKSIKKSDTRGIISFFSRSPSVYLTIEHFIFSIKNQVFQQSCLPIPFFVVDFLKSLYHVYYEAFGFQNIANTITVIIRTWHKIHNSI